MSGVHRDIFDLGQLSPDDLEEEICTLTAELFAGTARLLELVAEFDERGDWEARGFGSCSTWLAWRLSMMPRTAREHVRVARDLRELPLVSAAFSRGELSYSKVRALTRLRMVRADREAELLLLARHATGAQLDKLVRTYARVTPVPYLEPGNLSSLSHNLNDDGTMSIHVRLPAEDGAVVLNALKMAADPLWEAEVEARKENRAGGSAEPRRATKTDCLVDIASSYMARGRRSLSCPEKYQVVVESDPPHIRGLGPVAHETARRISCDSSLVEASSHMSGSMSIGRRSRSIPAPMRRMLERRDTCCRFPGCENTIALDSHHMVHWADGGETSTDNLVRLCRRHHRLVHEGGWGVESDPDKGVVFIHPLRGPMEASPPLLQNKGGSGSKPRATDRRSPDALIRRNRALGIRPDAETSRDLSRGERMNLDYAVSALAEFCG